MFGNSNLQQPTQQPDQIQPTLAQNVQQSFQGATGQQSFLNILSKLGLMSQPPTQPKQK